MELTRYRDEKKREEVYTLRLSDIDIIRVPHLFRNLSDNLSVSQVLLHLGAVVRELENIERNKNKESND